ncbi:hypothetical protein RQP46_001816 [Phenoliferia psychrophenolica]
MEQLLDSLRDLHDLRQVIHATQHCPELEPFVVLCQLRRRPTAKGKETEGAVEWVVCVGQARGGTEDKWWSTALALPEVEALITIPGSALKGEAMIRRMREAAVAGNMDVALAGYPDSLELIFTITPTLAVSVPLKPTTSAPLSLISLLTTIIPASLRAEEAVAAGAAATSQLAALQTQAHRLATDNRQGFPPLTHPPLNSNAPSRLHSRNKELIKKAKIGRGGGASSQAGGASPKKAGPVVPGVTVAKKSLKAGQPGFAGSGKRLGVVPQNDDFVDSDDD